MNKTNKWQVQIGRPIEFANKDYIKLKKALIMRADQNTK